MAAGGELRQGWHGAIIELFEIDLSSIGPGYSGVYRFTNDASAGSVDFGGSSYTSFPIEATGFEVTTKGTAPQPRITVANVLGTLSAAVTSAEDLVGAKVTRRRTIAGSSQEFPEDIFYIQRKVSESNIAITWELGSRVDLEGLRLPKRIITQNQCIWRYRGPECGYSGGPVGDSSDSIPTGSSAEAGEYAGSLQAAIAARAALNNAKAEYAAALNEVDAVCDVEILQRSDEKFRLRRGATDNKYSFAIENNNQYFAAYNEGVLVPKRNFDYTFGTNEEGDAVYGETQNTNRGSRSNGTGPLYRVNVWRKESGEPAYLEQSLYDIPNTFGFYGLDDIPIIAVNGRIVSIDEMSSVKPGKKPGFNGQSRLYALGTQQSSGVGPVSSLKIWEVGTGQCDKAQARLAAAESALEAAQEAADNAESNTQAKLAAVPPGDAIFSQDQCGKSLTSCRLRFGAGVLPFGAFPGANLYR